MLPFWALANVEVEVLRVMMKVTHHYPLSQTTQAEMEDEDPYLPLHRACYERNSRQLGKYLRAGANVNQRDASGCTPLIVAVKQGATTNAFQLFGYDPEIDARDAHGRTALMHAVSTNNDCMALHLLARKADPNAQDVLGVTPLIEAVRQGFDRVVKRLLHALSINVNATDHAGVTALYLAAEAGRLDMVSTLVHHRANVHHASCRRKTPLMAAAEKGHATVVAFLVDHGANVNVQDVYGYTALQYACEHGYLEIVKLLHHHGATFFLRDPQDQSTLLITAAKKGHEDIVAFLVTRVNVDVNASDVADRTALYYACKHSGMFKLLLEHHASPHMVDQSNKTVLMRACQVGNAQACRALLQYPLVNVDYIDTDGKTALMYACIYGKVEAATVLFDHGASALVADDDDQTPLMLASFMGRKSIVDLFLARQDRVDIGLDLQDCNGWTALHRACTRGHVEIVTKLMAAGASPIVADHEGVTPLMLACSYGDGAMVHAMITGHPGHINQENHKQQTAVFYACKLEHEECLDILLDSDGVDLNKADHRGMTPLMMVAAFGNLSMVTKLVNRGVALDAQDHAQRTALYYACDTGNGDVATFLLQRGANAALSCANLTTPLMLGCLDGDKAIVSAVLGTPNLDPAYINLVDHHSMTALFHAVSCGHGPIVDVLLERGADITIVSDTGATPLMEAAEKAEVHIVNQLVATIAADDSTVLTAYVNQADDEEQTALHKAAISGSCTVISRLLEVDASLHPVDVYGNTPLLSAAIRRHVDAVRLLVDQSNERINHLNGEHKTVLYYALRSRSHLMIQHVLANGGDLRFLFETHAIWSTGYPNDFSVDTLRVILRHLDDDLLDEVNSQGKTALYHLAFSYGNKYEAIKMFLTRGANPWISAATATLPIEGARTLLIRRVLKDAMYEPERSVALHKARFLCDARHHANTFVPTPSARTRAQKRQKCVATTPYLLKNRVASARPLPAVEVGTSKDATADTASQTLVGVVQHICDGHLNNDVFHELRAMMQMRWE